MTDRKTGWIGIEPAALVNDRGDVKCAATELVLSWVRKGYDVRIINSRMGGDKLRSTPDIPAHSVAKWLTRNHDTMIPVVDSIDEDMCEFWGPRARQIDDNAIEAELPRQWYSPLAEWVSKQAAIIDSTDPGGIQTMGVIITAAPGHVEVYMTDSLKANDLLCHGVIRAGELEIADNAERHFTRLGSEDDGHTD